MNTSKSTSQLIFDFHSESDTSEWFVLNDGVMGGVSKSSLRIDENGHGVFSGEVSTVNNGGFASVRYRPDFHGLSEAANFSLRIKGDGRSYQLRVKKDGKDDVSFVQSFTTSGSWETIHIALNELYPSYRGRHLDQPNYDGTSLGEIGFLIANGRDERFQLCIDSISIQQ